MMPIIIHVHKLIQQGDYAFSIDLKDAYLHNPIVKHCHNCCDLFGWINLSSGRFCYLGL